MASPSLWTFFARVALLTLLATLAAKPAVAQTPSSLGTDWVGSVRCDIKATAPGYLHEERQTWTLSGPPTVQGSQLVYPAAWTVTGQGTHDRTGTTSRRVAQWTAAVPGPNPPVNAPISFQAAPVTGQINVRPWHSQLTRQGGYTGTEQYINSGVPQPPGRLVATLYEWQMPNLVAEPKSTQISGTSTFEARAQVGPLQPLSESQVIITCAWELGRGSANPLPPSTVPDTPSSGSTSSNTPSATPPGSTTTPPGSTPPAGSTASTNPGSTPPANPPGSTTTPPGGTAPPPSTSTATILNVSPASLEQGALGSVLTIIGGSTRWIEGAPTVTVEPSIGAPVTNAQPVSDTSLLAQLDVQWSAAPGPRTVTVRSGNEVLTLANAFTVVARAQPVLVSATPNTPRSAGDQNVSLTLTGRNTRWAQGKTRVSVGIPVQGNFGSSDAQPNYVSTPTVTVHSATSLTAVFNIPANATPGSYGVAVWDTNPGDWLRLVDVFTVTNASGSSSGNSTTPPPAGSSPVAIIIDTTDLQFGQVNVGSEKSLPATLTNKGTQPFGPINLFGGAPPSGKFGAGQNCQGATLAPGQSCSIVYSFAPAAAGAVTDSSDFTISGTPNQSDGVGMRVALSGTGVAAAAGTPGGRGGANRPPLSFAQMTANPEFIRRGNNYGYTAMSIAGTYTNWQQGATTVSFGPGVTVDSLRVNSPTSLTVAITAAADAPLGPRTITVTTGSEVVTLAGFEVVDSNATSIESLNPSSGAQGTQNLSVTVTGRSTHWLPGNASAFFGPGISVSSVTVHSPTSLTAVVNIDPQAAPGGREVSIIRGLPGIVGEGAYRANAFTVTAAATSSSSGTTSPTRPVNSLPTVSTGGGGGLTAAAGTPPTNPVDPSNFIATQTGEGTVRLTWNAVPGAGSYMLGGPGTNAGVAVTGTSHTVTGIAAGTHTWTVATNYNPGGVMTTPDKWSKTTTTLVTRTGRYRISLTGFRVNHETNAGPFGREHNAVYAAAAVEVINRSTKAVLQPITVVKSLVHGDTSKAGGRVRAGSASSTGGLLAGDTVPMGEDPAASTRSTSTTTFPLLLWEGPLTDGVEVVAVRPTLWVWAGGTRVYDAWLAGLSNPQRYIGDESKAKISNGDYSPSFGGGGFDIWCSESGIYDTAHAANCLPSDDRPIGLIECNAFLGCWAGVTLFIARDGIERAFASPYQAGGSLPGVIQIHLADKDPSFGLNRFSGNYDLYLRVERVP